MVRLAQKNFNCDIMLQADYLEKYFFAINYRILGSSFVYYPSTLSGTSQATRYSSPNYTASITGGIRLADQYQLNITYDLPNDIASNSSRKFSRMELTFSIFLNEWEEDLDEDYGEEDY